MRIMGLDFGSKTVGVAISDPLLVTAQGIEIIRRKEENKLRKTCARIEELIEEYEIDELVLGYPKNMNDTLGDRIEKTEEFKEYELRKRKSLHCYCKRHIKRQKWHGKHRKDNAYHQCRHRYLVINV